MIEFAPWPKTPRLFRDVVITEKIDGTNAAVHIAEAGPAGGIHVDGGVYQIGAQSRKRLISPLDDNFGFASWVAKNADGLVRALGVGVHYGEWWGSGIQCGYGLPAGDKRFSLFNVNRWIGTEFMVPGLGVVPLLYEGPLVLTVVDDCLGELRQNGSHAAPGYTHPEGVIVWHTAARQAFKVLLDNDALPKGLAA